EASLLKIKGTEIQQALTELMMLARGPNALALEDDADVFRAAAAYCNLRKTSIYGGTNEIQKNIISRTILGL
ncbi:MAG: acyl-CoA dehydrogenase family protein, partial [Myxococcales bacterium]